MRDFALISLLYGTGLRSQEAVNLRLRAIIANESDSPLCPAKYRGESLSWSLLAEMAQKMRNVCAAGDGKVVVARVNTTST